jgi:peptidoglycan/LPS O-acetylase OafA/YrhL
MRDRKQGRAMKQLTLFDRSDRPDSIGAMLDRNGGIGTGFDALRVALAIAVVSYHGVTVTQGRSDVAGPFWLIYESVLPMFFALSGFLIIASARRLPLGEFLINRGLRIFPALSVEIIFSAVVIGTLFTTHSLASYYTDRMFLSYFLNIFGDIHYFLPGVFEDRPHWGIVNASLWTIPWELGLYGMMVVLIVTGLIRNSRFLLGLAIATILLPLVAALWAMTDGSLNDSAVVAKLTGWEFRVVPFFLAGMLFYLLRYRVTASTPLAAAVVAMVGIGTLVVPASWDGPWLNFVLCPALTYLTVFIGVCKLPRLPLFSRGDYSYGIYLYGYPLQQIVNSTGFDDGRWWLNAALSLPLITVFAMFSWHMIEKPILKRRRWLVERLRRRQMAAVPA